MSTPQPAPTQRTGLSKWRRSLGLAFVASTGIFLLLVTALFASGAVPGVRPWWPRRPTPTRTPTATVTPTPPYTSTAVPGPSPTFGPTPTPEPMPVVGSEVPALALITGIVGIVTSCLTSVTTFVGFMVTTAMTLSKDRREARDAELERRKRELELEKQKLEIEELKQQHKPPDKDHPTGS